MTMTLKLFGSSFPIGSVVTDDPDTSTWGAEEAGRAWFNFTKRRWKGWDGDSIQSLASPFPDIRDYGAVVDGRTDDYSAIQAAIDDSDGVVLFPPGICIIETSLSIISNTVLTGMGIGISTIKQGEGANLTAMLVNSDQSSGNTKIAIQCITFDGNKSNQTGGTGKGLFLYKVTDLVMKDFEVKNCYGSAANAYGIHGEEITRGKFEGFVMSGNNGGGLAVHGDNIKVEDFYVDQTGGLASNGIAIGTGAYASINSTNVTIRKGTVLNSYAINVQMAADHGLIESVYSTGSGQGGAGGGIDIARSNDATVRNNHLYANRGGIISESQTPDDATVSQGNYKIIGNVIHGQSTGYGIYLETSGTSGGTIVNVTIRDNTVYSCQGGMWLYGISGLVIDGNKAFGNKGYGSGSGIAITACSRVSIDNSTLYGVTGGAMAQSIGLYVGKGTTQIQIGPNNQMWGHEVKATGEQTANTITPLFTASDATPSVAGYKTFCTANVAPTTITHFDDCFLTQEFIVLFGDSVTTIDFSGTRLHGNGGVDWTPSAGDFMRCVVFFNVSDGYYHVYCTCVDTTT